jgi:hypothetical protein
MTTDMFGYPQNDWLADTLRAVAPDPDHFLTNPMANQEAILNAEIRELKLQLAEMTERRDYLRGEVERMKIKLSRMCSDA